MKILTIIGARPQFVKAAALSRQLKNYSHIEEVIVHTGQHFDKNMSDIFFEDMEIPKPKYNLNINCLKHGAMTGRMLEGIELLIDKEQPELVLVYGDTNSTLAGALAAKKLHIKVAHIEAGLRSFNMKMPEEINRILTDRISDILFCPTDIAVENLKKEGFEYFNCKIVKSGDIMLDAAYYYAQKSAEKSIVIQQNNLGKYILCTLHRAENTDDLKRLKNIVDALNRINNEVEILLPLHPRTLNIIKKNNIKLNIKVIEPVGYLDMIELIKNCLLVMTDSGGLQKEAYFFKRNCLTLRDQTEWVELIKNEVNVLVGADKKKIYDAYLYMINKKSDFKKNLYGSGKASKKIVQSLLESVHNRQ